MANTTDSKVLLESRQNELPDRQNDGSQKYQTGDRRGRAQTKRYNKSGAYGMAEQGARFFVTNPTARTGLAGHAAPVIADGDDKAFFYLRNADTSTDYKRIYLDYIMLTVTAAGAGATDQSYWTECDTGTSRLNATPGGTALTPRATNMDLSSTSIATCRAGAVASDVAASVDRRAGQSGIIRTVVPVVGDRYLFVFGQDMLSQAGNIINGTAPANVIIPHEPVILGATDQFLLHLWGVSQSGAHSYEVLAAWHEE